MMMMMMMMRKWEEVDETKGEYEGRCIYVQPSRNPLGRISKKVLGIDKEPF